MEFEAQLLSFAQWEVVSTPALAVFAGSIGAALDEPEHQAAVYLLAGIVRRSMTWVV